MQCSPTRAATLCSASSYAQSDLKRRRHVVHEPALGEPLGQQALALDVPGPTALAERFDYPRRYGGPT